MALLDLWRQSREEFERKSVHQVVTLGGDGALKDGSTTSAEFRGLLREVPSSQLRTYAQQCLNLRGMGFALQDIVNEVGRRLGLTVKDGLYQGVQGKVGADGVWSRKDGYSIVVEVKTTDEFTVDSDTVERYRKALIAQGDLTEAGSSNLIVVGRSATTTIEAQIRGSRQAWNTRLIGIEALLQLMAVKEDMDEPETENRIHRLLEPREFTRLDDIVELLFATKEDIRKDVEPEADSSDPAAAVRTRGPYKSFNDACVRRVEQHIGVSFLKRSRASYASTDGQHGLICCVSKVYREAGADCFWFGFHPHQQAFLSEFGRAYIAFGCGSEDLVVLLPFDFMKDNLSNLNTTVVDGRKYWHVQMRRQGGSFDLLTKRGGKRLSLLPHVLAAPPPTLRPGSGPTRSQRARSPRP